jgi:NAD(P)-dependent dehydrogenase (short-subunit alcohol dehydrogenase family)
MARIFITGSADGLGQLAARRLVALGHDVVLCLAAPQPARGPKDMTDYQAVVLHRDQVQLRRATPSYAVTRSAPARCADRSCPALSNAAAASSSIGE